MEKGANTFEYFFLITNVFILFIFYFHFYKNRHWFLRTYIIGKSLQLAGMLLLEFGRYLSFLQDRDITSIFFIVGFPFEIFGLISYDGRFSKKIFHSFVIASIILCIADVVMMLQHLKGILLPFTSIFFYNYGGIVLLSKKDKSRFRYLIGGSFIVYFLISLIIGLILISHPGHQSMFVQGIMQPPRNNILDLYSSLIYFVMIVSSIGYLVILKEQDELALDIANELMSKENLNLKKLDEQKNEFFSLIAHDLRGPIGTLTNLTEMLVGSRDKFRQVDYEKWLDLINQTATRTYTLLNNLLQWARSESGTLTPNPEIINLKELIDDVIRLMQAFAEGKNIQLTSNCPGDIEIFADREMIRTVIRNLISNGIKFTNNNGSIQVKAKHGKHPVISVTDSGIGMSSEVKNNLFALNSSYSTPGTNKEEGSGIGLKLTQEFVKRNNGRIWIESTEDVGTTFYVKLPARGTDNVMIN
jgi:two-component system, sensor histidine kinase and response regulator